MLKKITDKEYFGADQYLNASALKQFAKSPAHYLAYTMAPVSYTHLRAHET